MSPAERLSWRLKLSPALGAILARLIEGPATSAQIFAVACPIARDDGDYKVVHVQLCNLRREMKRRRVGTVITAYPDGQWREGHLGACAALYALDDAGRAWVEEALAAPERTPSALDPRREWRLSRAEALIFSRLAVGGIVSEQAITEASPSKSTKSAKVLLLRLRAKLARFGLRIENVFGQGWCLSDESLAKLATQGPAR